MHEAAIRRAPVTVLTVHPVPMNAWTGTPITLPRDAEDQAADRLGQQPGPCITVVHHAHCPVVVVPSER
jgi:hypothetical protein